jgi:hypothetical protein
MLQDTKKKLVLHFAECLITGFCIALGEMLARNIFYRETGNDSGQCECQSDEEDSGKEQVKFYIPIVVSE